MKKYLVNGVMFIFLQQNENKRKEPYRDTNFGSPERGDSMNEKNKPKSKIKYVY